MFFFLLSEVILIFVVLPQFFITCEKSVLCSIHYFTLLNSETPKKLKMFYPLWAGKGMFSIPNLHKVQCMCVCVLMFVRGCAEGR